jgi:hypothetical protein
MVEFALLAPIFLGLVLGVVEMGEAIDTSQLLTSAVREGGRLATMDWSGSLPEGTTVNQKVITDIRNFLSASGLPGDQLDIQITSASGTDAGQTFDLGDPDNDLRLFKIEVKIPFEQATSYHAMMMRGHVMKGSLTFRAGRSLMVN